MLSILGELELLHWVEANSRLKKEKRKTFSNHCQLIFNLFANSFVSAQDVNITQLKGLEIVKTDILQLELIL